VSELSVGGSSEPNDEWAHWSDEALRDYEDALYDREVDGHDTWFERDRVLWEMNRRGLCS
jgi:hypothetical protein